MEWLDQLWQTIVNYIDGIYLLSFMLLAYLVKRYFQVWLTQVLKFEVKTVFIVLVIATLTAVPFLLFGSEWQKILFSYTLGTSLHELIFKWIEDKFSPKS